MRKESPKLNVLSQPPEELLENPQCLEGQPSETIFAALMLTFPDSNARLFGLTLAIGLLLFKREESLVSLMQEFTIEQRFMILSSIINNPQRRDYGVNVAGGLLSRGRHEDVTCLTQGFTVEQSVALLSAT